MRPSAILSLVGGIGVIAAFFLPVLSGSYIVKDPLKNWRVASPKVVFEAKDVPEKEKARVEATRKFLEAIGYDDFYKSMEGAKGKDERNQLIKDYNISAFQAMRMFQVLDFNAEAVEPEKSEKTKNVRAGARMFWLATLWIAVSAGLAVLLALARRFKALNTFQVAWNGLFGLLWLGGAVAMLLVKETEKVGGVTVNIFQGFGIPVLLAFSAILWLSAFAGLSKKNWWKTPLVGLLLVLLVAASAIVPSLIGAA